MSSNFAFGAATHVETSLAAHVGFLIALGVMGVSSFGSLLTPGLGSILAVAASLATVVMRNGSPTEVKQMELTITCDHRHIYGADAAMFMKTLAGIIEVTPLDIVL